MSSSILSTFSRRFDDVVLLCCSLTSPVLLFGLAFLLLAVWYIFRNDGKPITLAGCRVDVACYFSCNWNYMVVCQCLLSVTIDYTCRPDKSNLKVEQPSAR